MKTTKHKVKGYNPEFVKSILDGKKEVENGEFIEIKNPANVWESIK